MIKIGDGPWTAGAMFAVYTTLALGWRATTFGKSMFELEVVSSDTGERPRWRQVLARQAAFVAPATVLAVLREAMAPFGSGVQVAFSIPLGLWIAFGFINVAYAAWRRPGKRTMWDRVSHTQVRYRATRAAAGALLR